ncbi:DUF6094 domain-containing protein [Edaphobacter dinghuensis]|uniref:DUF6094 domain-containing protein n=1 Tax=Edaphobacter dinghuensis TaxID=1560005 RepID=A0A917HR18_9BACT|nr:DUF6094 domain-containing protein [Edaphobacter dinghuensis]GGG87007.1 hypothetical protein GCM10011585_33760 [Edaphobacter dinghuensis]
MRSSGRLKLGYYPLPEPEGVRLRNLLDFPPEGASVLDPCVGAGDALRQITENAGASLYGVELDTERARCATASGISTIHGNLFGASSAEESFSLLYLNPPYDHEIGSYDNKRMEYLFLKHTYPWLVQGGILIFVVLHAQLEPCIPLLSSEFGWFQVFRLTDPESERFDQIVLLAARKRVPADAQEMNRKALVEAIYRSPLPALTGAEPKYAVPATPPAKLTYRGLPLDEIETLLPQSSAWRKVAAFLLPREDAAIERPITPFHPGHVGLLCTAGMLNGVAGNGEDRHIARWQTKKYVTTFTEAEEKYTEIHRQERFSNEVAIIYANGRTLVLTDKKKGEEGGERAPAVGTA